MIDQKNNRLIKFKPKLYGRSDELNELTRLFEKSFNGQNQLVFIKGRSGVGKSALVNQFEYQLRSQENVFFLSGKQDVNLNNPPYTTIKQAFNGLIDAWNHESEDKKENIKEVLINKMGNQLSFLIDIFPKLNNLIQLNADQKHEEVIEFKDRFNETFLKFIDLLPEFGSKIVVFLDDLQWADLATVQFLKLWLTEGRTNSVFWIGSYRDNEVDEGSWLYTTGLINEKAENGVTSIALSELDSKMINAMFSDVLVMSEERMESFSEVIFQLTGGNPFFVKEALRFVQEDGIIEYNLARSNWDYDFSKISEANTSNVKVDFIFRRMKSIEPETLGVLSIAAAVGKAFNKRILEGISIRSEEEIEHAIEQCVNAQIIKPVQPKSGNKAFVYEFVHDKMQNAAYSSLSPEKKASIHFAIGKTYEGALGYAAEEKNIYDIVNHYNRSSSFFKTEEQKAHLVGLNIKAGTKAKGSSSFNQAIKYYEVAIKLIEKTENEWNPDLVFETYLQAGEAAYLRSDFVSSVMYFESALKYAKHNFQKARVHHNFLVMYNSVSDVDAAWESGIKTLELLSVKIPKRINKLTVFKAFTKINFKLKKVDFNSLLDQKDMEDKEAEQILLTLMELISSAWDKSPEILAYIVLKGFEILLKNGNSPIAYFGVAGYGAILGIGFGRIEEGWKYIKLGGELTEKYDSDIFHGRGNFAVHGTYSHLIHHVRFNVEPLKDAYNFTKAAGDYSIAAYSSILLMENMFILDFTIDEIQEQAKSYFNFLKRTSNFDYLTAQKGIVVALDLLKHGPTEDVVKELEHVKASMDRVSFTHIRYAWRVYYLDTLMQLGQFEEAFELQNTIFEEKYEGLSAIEYHVIILHTWVYAEKIKKGVEMRKAKTYLKKRIKYCEKMVRINPNNFGFLLAYLRAVYAQLNDRLKQSTEFMKEAVRLAENSEYSNYEALFCEGLAELCLKNKDQSTAKIMKDKAKALHVNRGSIYRSELIK